MDTQSAVSQAKLALRIFREKKVTFLAGSIAYSAFVSLVPLVMFFLLAVSVFGAPELQQEIIDVATEHVSPSVGGVLDVMIQEQRAAGPGSTISATLIGLVIFLWGAIKVFRGLDTAFSEIYETTAQLSLLGQVKKSLVMLATLALGVIAMVAMTAVVAFVPSIPYIGYVVPVLLVIGLCGVFFPMYYLFPDVDVAPRDVIPGVIIGAVGWAVLQVLFQLYVSLTGSGGSLIASILLLVTWLYFSAVILLFGAAVNAVGRVDAGTPGDEPAGVPVVDAAMSREETVSYLRGLRTDLTGRSEDMGASTEGADAGRNPPQGPISITEWAQDTDTGRHHEVHVAWDTASED